MATLKHTPLRHRMLARVDSAPVGTFFWMQGWGCDSYQSTSGTRLTGPERRALREMDQARVLTLAAGSGFSGRDLSVSDTGSALLSEWNTRHGNPLAEESE